MNHDRGGDCFLNVAVQTLLRLESFKDLLSKLDDQAHEGTGIRKCLSKLLTEIETSDPVNAQPLSVAELRVACGLQPGSREDAAEVLIKLLQELKQDYHLEVLRSELFNGSNLELELKPGQLFKTPDYVSAKTSPVKPLLAPAMFSVDQQEYSPTGTVLLLKSLPAYCQIKDMFNVKGTVAAE